jgi:pimeloyl-ACP methyl ester carboxylesterase
MVAACRVLHDDVEIAFLDEGEGEPIVLVHGFASNKEVNWVYPGWVSTLTRAGRRVIALDNRGHGASTKLYDPAAYHSAIMAEDVRALIDHLGLPRADVMGYSLARGLRRSWRWRIRERVRAAVLGGLGIHLVDGVGAPTNDRGRAEAPTRADVSDPVGHMFRAFAEQTRSDLRALAACIRGSRQTLSATKSAASRCRSWSPPAAGPDRRFAGTARRADAGGQALVIPGRDHMLAVGDKVV